MFAVTLYACGISGAVCCGCSELIRRYREKGQECSSLQEQLRQALGQEASLKQSLVGLRAEVSALLKEKENMRDVVTASQWEKELAETRATNAEVCVVSTLPVPTSFRAVDGGAAADRSGRYPQRV